MSVDDEEARRRRAERLRKLADEAAQGNAPPAGTNPRDQIERLMAEERKRRAKDTPDKPQ
jgi:hypothetical protein